MPEGPGELKFANDSLYLGQFRNGEMHGIGTIYYKDGSEYRGEFISGKKHGKGLLKDSDGHVKDKEYDMGVEISCTLKSSPNPQCVLSY